MSEVTETKSVTEVEKPHIALGRVLNLSIFFVGIGAYATAGFALQRLELFTDLQLTYFAVGVAIGAVGLLLWLVTR